METETRVKTTKHAAETTNKKLGNQERIDYNVNDGGIGFN